MSFNDWFSPKPVVYHSIPKPKPEKPKPAPTKEPKTDPPFKLMKLAACLSRVYTGLRFGIGKEGGKYKLLFQIIRPLAAAADLDCLAWTGGFYGVKEMTVDVDQDQRGGSTPKWGRGAVFALEGNIDVDAFLEAIVKELNEKKPLEHWGDEEHREHDLRETLDMLKTVEARIAEGITGWKGGPDIYLTDQLIPLMERMLRPE